MLRAVIFDVDGTLADTERDGHRAAFNAAFEESGLPWHWDERLYGELLCIGGGQERIRAYARRVCQPGDLQAFAEALHDVKNRHFRRIVESGAVRLRPGVARLIGELRDAEVPIAIATTAGRDTVEALLEANLGRDSLGWFAALGTGEVVERKKPAPDVYRWVLGRLGLEGRDCIAIEDSHNGLCSSRGAGVRTLVTVTQYTAGEDFGGALAVLSDLGEPGSPCRVERGTLRGRQWVDLALLREWADAA